MEFSAKGLKLLQQWEGCINHVYKDAAGLPTIGIGHLIQKGEQFTTLTDQEALDLLARDISPKARVVNALVTVPLSQDQFDALVSFAFNCGTGAFQNSTLLKKLNKGDYASVPDELGKWTKAGGKQCAGLVTRRNNEIKLWRGEI